MSENMVCTSNLNPIVVEQETPEIDSTRDVEKIPKKRTPRTKKPTVVASAGKKRKTPRSGELPARHRGGKTKDKAEAEPQNSSSNEIPGLENIRVGKKEVSRELPKRILDSKTPPHNRPDIKVEPLDLNNAELPRKIKPKRLQNEELNNKTHKKPRLEKGTDFVGDVDSTHHSPDVPQGKDEDLVKEKFKLIKFVIDLVETTQNRHSLQKLKQHLLTYAEKLKL